MMRLLTDADLYRNRTRSPYAYPDRIRSRARGCFPGALDARCTPPEVRALRYLRDVDEHGYPRWFAVIAITAALAFCGWAATWLLP